MDTLTSTPTAAPGKPKARSAPPLQPDFAEAGPLRARFVLVEDVDHLMRTGEPRQVLRVRWVI
jgi:hypothetical protein